MNTKINETNSAKNEVELHGPPKPPAENDQLHVGASQKPQDFGEFAKTWKGVIENPGVAKGQSGEQKLANPLDLGDVERPGDVANRIEKVLDEMEIGESSIVKKKAGNPFEPVQKEQPTEEGKEGSNPFKEFGDEGPDLPDYSEDLKQIEALFEGFINRGALVVLKADPGVGASWVGLDMGLAASQAVSLYSKMEHIKAANGKENTVIFIERGMSYSQISERKKELTGGEKSANSLTIYSADQLRYKDTSYSNLDMTSASVQQTLLDWASKYHNLVMIFDRLSSLVVPTSTDKVSDFHKWVIQMKEVGATMIWVDQGKNGSYDLPKDYVDTELKLSEVPNRPHLAIKVEFIRARSLPKSSTLPFVIELKEREDTNGLHFVYSSIEADKQVTALVLAAEGEHTQSQIASKLKVSQGTISNWLRQAEIEKLIQKQGRNIWLTSKGKEATKNSSRNFNY